MDSVSQAPSPAPSPAPGPAVTGICELSPHARFFSSILTAFVGAIIGSVSSGSFTAFFTATLCWLGTFRILIIGLWQVAQAVRLRPLDAFIQLDKECGRDEGDNESVLDAPQTLLGWVVGWGGWLYSTCYAPTSQVLWLVGNWNGASGGLKLVRAVGVTVSALPLTLDSKGRYGAALEACLGRWSRYVFSFIASGACLVLAVTAAVELVVAAIELKLKWYNIFFYTLFSLVVAVSSFFPMPLELVKDHPGLYFMGHKILDRLMWGVMAGCFTGAPALALMLTAKKTPGLSLAEYIRCKPVALWRKFICIFP